MPRPKKRTRTTTHARPTPSRGRRRDTSILRLWRDGWTSKTIADHLAIAEGIVRNVVEKSGEAHKPYRKTISVSVADAPIEAWQQAVLPELEHAAGDVSMDDDTAKRALVFLGLLRLKPYDDLAAFQLWVHQVTGYAPEEIAAFVTRASENFLIVDGQPNRGTLDAVEINSQVGYVELMLIAKVLQGRFRRTADGQYAEAEA